MVCSRPRPAVLPCCGCSPPPTLPPAAALTAAARAPPARAALLACADVSRPGGAGHALLFADNGLLLENFRGLGETAGRAGAGAVPSAAAAPPCRRERWPRPTPLLARRTDQHYTTRLERPPSYPPFMCLCCPCAAAPDAFTFEAWLSTTDYCTPSALLSYAVPSTSGDPHQATADANHLVSPSAAAAVQDRP